MQKILADESDNSASDSDYSDISVMENEDTDTLGKIIARRERDARLLKHFRDPNYKIFTNRYQIIGQPDKTSEPEPQHNTFQPAPYGTNQQQAVEQKPWAPATTKYWGGQPNKTFEPKPQHNTYQPAPYGTNQQQAVEQKPWAPVTTKYWARKPDKTSEPEPPHNTYQPAPYGTNQQQALEQESELPPTPNHFKYPPLRLGLRTAAEREADREALRNRPAMPFNFQFSTFYPPSQEDIDAIVPHRTAYTGDQYWLDPDYQSSSPTSRKRHDMTQQIEKYFDTHPTDNRLAIKRLSHPGWPGQDSTTRLNTQAEQDSTTRPNTQAQKGSTTRLNIQADTSVLRNRQPGPSLSERYHAALAPEVAKYQAKFKHSHPEPVITATPAVVQDTLPSPPSSNDGLEEVFQQKKPTFNAAPVLTRDRSVSPLASSDELPHHPPATAVDSITRPDLPELSAVQSPKPEKTTIDRNTAATIDQHTTTTNDQHATTTNDHKTTTTNGQYTTTTNDHKTTSTNDHKSQSTEPSRTATQHNPRSQQDSETQTPSNSIVRCTRCAHCGAYSSVWKGLFMEARDCVYTKDPDTGHLQVKWIGATILMFLIWYLLESLLCYNYCMPRYAVKMKGYGVDPNAPVFPFVIPTLLLRPFDFLFKPLIAWLIWFIGATLSLFFGQDARENYGEARMPHLTYLPSAGREAADAAKSMKWSQTATAVISTVSRRVGQSTIDAIDGIGRLWDDGYAA